MTVRVLHAITRLTLGGSSENTIASCVALDRAGYECTLAASFRESDAASLVDARRRGCRVVDLPALGREVAPIADLAALAQILRLIRRERPAIVHTCPRSVRHSAWRASAERESAIRSRPLCSSGHQL